MAKDENGNGHWLVNGTRGVTLATVLGTAVAIGAGWSALDKDVAALKEQATETKEGIKENSKLIRKLEQRITQLIAFDDFRNQRTPPR